MGNDTRSAEELQAEIDELRARLAETTARTADLERERDALRRDQHLLGMLMDSMPDHIYFKDRQCRFIRINRAHAALFGLADPSEATGKTDFDFFTDLHAGQAYHDEQRIMKTGQPLLNHEEMETWPDGRITWASTTKMPLFDPRGALLGTFGISRDITDRKKAIEALRESEARYRGVVEDQSEMICRFWADTALTFANGAFGRFFGASPDRFIGAKFMDMLPAEDRSALQRRLESLGPWNPVTTCEVQVQGADGRNAWLQFTARALPDTEGAVLEYQLVGRDITPLKAVETELRRLAIVDPLTGAYNRRHFLARLDDEFRQSRRYGRPFALLMIDADFFKKVNDTHGHHAGDVVLCQITERCVRRLRNVDVFARWGGEEFVALLPETDLAGAATAARDLCRLLAETPVDAGGAAVRFTVSIGVAELRDDMKEPNDLIKASDAAMYAAKANGRDRVEVAAP